MNQEAEKIINIEHADNVHIELSGLFGSKELLNHAIKSMPGLLENTIAMLLSQLDPNMPMTPATIKRQQENTFSVGDIVMSHWQIDRCIGRGSLSTIYEAHHTGHPGRLYRSAIKVIHPSFQLFDIQSSDITHRVFDAEDMIRMELDNLVDLRGTGYIVDYEDHEAIDNSNGSQDIIIRMELLNPLTEFLLDKTMSRDEVIRLGIDMCKALEFCHQSNIIHCDVKPSNIYITKWGGYKLGDFSASMKNGDHIGKNQIGTLKYMAPEVYQGKPFSSSIDTYSLGLVLYQLMNGNRMPFEINDAAAQINETALSHRLSGFPLPPIPGVDQSLQSVIFRACSYNPDERFSTPTEMLDELLKLTRES